MTTCNYTHPRNILVATLQRLYDYGMTTTSGGNISVKVSKNENLGMTTLVHGHIVGTKSNEKIVCKFKGWCDYKDGDNVMVSFNRMHFFDKETGNAIKSQGE